MQNKRKTVSNKIGKRIQRIRTAGVRDYIGIICILLLAIFISPASAESINIVSNPGFESGTSPWVFYTDGSGSFLNDATGDGSLHAGHIKISRQGTNVQLYQKNLVLEPNTLYSLDFKAYSNTGHDLSVSLFKHGSPYTNYGLSKSLDLDTKWGAHSIQFTTAGFPEIVNDARLMFWLANYDAVNDQFYFDDVILTKVSTQSQPVQPTIITHPSSQTIDVGKTATFSVTASGTSPLSYQWKKNGINIPGATIASYTTPSASISDNGASFSVVVTNSIGSVTSNPAKLTVVSVVPVSNQLSNPGFESGTSPWVFYTDGSGSFLNDATGYGSPHAGHIKISQQGTNVQLYQKNLELEADTSYRLDFKAYSNTGHDLSVSLFKHGSPYTNYGLSKSFDLGTTWGAHSIQFKTVGFSGIVNDARLMFWLAANDAINDQFYFDDVVLTKISSVLPPTQVIPKITVQPLGKTVSVGQTATFSVTASGTAPLSYQWKKNGINIPGATLASYTTPSASISDNGASFSVVVTNSIGSVTSNPAKLTVVSVVSVAKPTIITQPSSQTIVVGKTATFSVTASGTAPLSYQWKKNGINILGATSASYTTPSASLSDNGASFSVVVTNSIGSVTSNPAKLTVVSVASNQLVLLDVTYTHTGNATTGPRAFSFFKPPSWIPSNLVSPINYANGRLYQRVEVITKPSDKSVLYQMCLFQDYIVPEKHACTWGSGAMKFTGPGTYYSNQLMTSLYQYSVIDWRRSLFSEMLVVKDGSGVPVDNRYGWAGKWSGSPNFGLYYPMKVRYTAIIVPPGGGEPVWP